MKNYKTACIFGGTGFIGSQIVRELAARDVQIKVVTRAPERAYFLRPCGRVGQIVPVTCDLKDPESLREAVKGCDYVVNCIGILYEKHEGDFEAVHADFPAALAKACSKEKVGRFVHISALGVENAESHYAKSKLDGERGVLSNFSSATILRPSIVFGENDSFFNKFASLAEKLPFLPLIGGGQTKFQPVYVGDVADAAMAALEKLHLPGGGPQGQVYQLGGPEVQTFKELYETMFSYTKNPRPLVSVSYNFAKFQAGFLSLLPEPLLTKDQVETLKADNIVQADAKTLQDLGVHPTAMKSILPNYLSRFIQGGRFAYIKQM